MICTVHVSNNRQLNTLITVNREIEIDQKEKKKKKRLYIVHTRYYYRRKFKRRFV